MINKIFNVPIIERIRFIITAAWWKFDYDSLYSFRGGINLSVVEDFFLNKNRQQKFSRRIFSQAWAEIKSSHFCRIRRDARNKLRDNCTVLQQFLTN